MDRIVFRQWLQDEKNMSIRSANDVISRCKRIKKMTQRDSIDNDSIAILIELDAYHNMSSYIKSQLKRATTLYLEFKDNEEGKL